MLKVAEGVAVIIGQLPPDDDGCPAVMALRKTGIILHAAMANAVRRFPAHVLSAELTIKAITWLAESAIKISLRTAGHAAEGEGQQIKLPALHALAAFVGQAWGAMSDSLLPDGQQAASQSALSPTMLR